MLQPQATNCQLTVPPSLVADHRATAGGFSVAEQIWYMQTLLRPVIQSSDWFQETIILTCVAIQKHFMDMVTTMMLA